MFRWMMRNHPWTFVLFLLLYLIVGAGVIVTLASYASNTDVPPEVGTRPLNEWLEFLKGFWPILVNS